MKSENEISKISRVVTRINLLIKSYDDVVDDSIYLLIKSNKLWSDISFISVRYYSLDNINIPAMHNGEEWEIMDNEKKIFTNLLKNKQAEFNQEKVESIIKEQLEDIFGIKNIEGELLPDYFDNIVFSKTVNMLTFYRHYFYEINLMPEIARIMALKVIELIPLKLLKEIHFNNGKLHENYKPSLVLDTFIQKRFWEKERCLPIRLINKNPTKRNIVLFSDLKDFGLMVKSISKGNTDTTQEFIKKYQFKTSIAIKSQGGYVVQTAGDAFMAIFSLEEHVDEMNMLIKTIRACLQILSLEDLMINNTNIKFITRIGVNIASIEEGYIGSPDLREYTVFGKDVNIASRLEKKVDELAETIDGFAGGILVNLTNLSYTLNGDDEKILSQIFSIFNQLSEIQNLPWFTNKINSMNKSFHTDFLSYKLYEIIKYTLQSYLDDLNQIDTNYSFYVSDDLIHIEVKEGFTSSIFFYKKSKDISYE
jgi:hypothetical protein